MIIIGGVYVGGCMFIKGGCTCINALLKSRRAAGVDAQHGIALAPTIQLVPCMWPKRDGLERVRGNGG
jgi:hypothetical protein